MHMTFEHAVRLHVALITLSCITFVFLAYYSEILLTVSPKPTSGEDLTSRPPSSLFEKMMNGRNNHDEEKEREIIQFILRKAQPPILDWTQGQIHPEVTKLNLPDEGLSTLPSNFCEVFPNLSILFCPKNNFEELPAVLGKCKKLQMISFKSNGMKRIHPDALQTQLRWLILTDNQLEELPSTIGRCNKLQKLMLSGNRLLYLPSELKQCTNLELIRLASNQLQEAPVDLLTSLPNLGWVALSSNPFLEDDVERILSNGTATADSSLQILDDPTLEMEGEILGAGASGTTRKVAYNDTYVAVKEYVAKSITSDGNPLQERQVNVLVGASLTKSPYLVRVLGQTAIKKSLVMELLQGMTALGKPPSMKSCTRDVYDDDDQKLTEYQSRTIVRGMWEILTQLHRLHVFHGDFYGHNILISQDLSLTETDNFQVKLSDFGAAFICDGKVANAMERIELRAYGHLVSEVRHLLYRSKPSSEMLEKLQDLSDACLSISTNNNDDDDHDNDNDDKHASPTFASVKVLVDDC